MWQHVPQVRKKPGHVPRDCGNAQDPRDSPEGGGEGQERWMGGEGKEGDGRDDDEGDGWRITLCEIQGVLCQPTPESRKAGCYTFFYSFAGVTGVTVAPLPSPSAWGPARLTATPRGASGRCRDGTRAVRSEFPSSFSATFAQSLPRYLPGTHRHGSSVTDSS